MTVIEKNYDWAYSLTPRSVTTHLILHHAAASSTTPDGIHAYHKSKGWAGIAYHYFVSKDGSVCRGRPENMIGAHTMNWNYCSIGICFEGNFENETMQAAQLQAGCALIADIKTRYPNIVVGRHCDFGQTCCPGKNFPFSALVSNAEPARDAEQEKAPADWAKSACESAVEKGIFKGDGSDYRWHDPVTREELAVILERISRL